MNSECMHGYRPHTGPVPGMGGGWVQDRYPDCPVESCRPGIPYVLGEAPRERDVAWHPHPVALLVAPYSTATPLEQMATSRAMEQLVKCGWAPVYYPYALSGLLDDDLPEERAAALAASQAFVHALSVSPAPVACFVVGARSTEGMELDLAAWGEGGPVYCAPGDDTDLVKLVELGDDLRRACAL